MNFTDKLVADLLRVDFTARNKPEALQKIAEIAARDPRLNAFGEDALYNHLMEREDAVSTGIGGEIAIPHARLAGLEDFVVFVLVAPKGIEFESLDKRKVRLFFVVFAPEEKVGEQLKLLASISRTLSNTNLKKELLNTRTPDVLQEVLARVGAPDADSKRTATEKKKLLLMVLYYEDDLTTVLEYLLDRGIDGATILETKGMGAYVSNMPLFASFLGFMREDRNVSRTMMTLVPEKEADSIVRGLESITGDLEKKQGAMIMLLDVSFQKGTMSMI